jgi:hypothetical protein
MYKFNIGQKVIICPNLKVDSYVNEVYINHEMSNFFGRICTIRTQYLFRNKPVYSLNEVEYVWSEDMLHPAFFSNFISLNIYV